MARSTSSRQSIGSDPLDALQMATPFCMLRCPVLDEGFDTAAANQVHLLDPQSQK